MWCGFVHFAVIKSLSGLTWAWFREGIAHCGGEAKVAGPSAVCGGGCLRQLARILADQGAGGWT